MSKSGKIGTDGGADLQQNPFASLMGLKLPNSPAVAPPRSQPGATPQASASPRANRGRVDIKRATAGRGGKTVTVVSGFTGIGQLEKESLAKAMRAACGCGGTVKDGVIEIQGDQRDKIAAILAAAGFRPVFAGG